MSQPITRTTQTLLTLRLLLTLSLVGVAGSPLLAQTSGDTGADLRGADVTGGVSDRDNTRVMGTAYDSAQQPLTGVQIWVANDTAPATRVRSKTRKTGSYLVRGLPRLYTRDDLYDIDLRVTFEKSGYQTVEAVVNVQRDGLVHVYPVMLKEGEADPRTQMSVLLAGQIVDGNGKPVKGAVLKLSDPSGGDLSLEVPAEKDGTYEVFLWQAPSQLQLSVSSPKGSTEVVANLAASPNPRAILAQTVDLTIP